MIRTINVVLVITSICALVGVYALKYSVGETASEKSAIQRHIERQQADLSLLKADWAFLNQPSNVAPIVTRHVVELNMQSLAQDQFGRFDALPMRMAQPDSFALDSLFEALDAGVDPIQQLITEAE
jgi:hypothetical protein